MATMAQDYEGWLQIELIFIFLFNVYMEANIKIIEQML